MTLLTITLSVILPTPLKVNAIDDNTNNYLYVIGIIASYAGIDIDVDEVLNQFPDFIDDVIDLAIDIYDELAEEYGWTNDTQSGHSGSGSHRDPNVIDMADDLERYLNYISNQLQPFNPVGIGVNYKFVLCMVRAISRWYDEHYQSQGSSSSAPSGMSILHGDISSSSGSIDFYTENSFSFTFPTISTSSNTTSIVEFALNDCIITFYFNPTNDLYLGLVGNSSSDTSVKSGWCAFVIAPLNSNVRLVCRGQLSYLSNFSSLSSISGKTFYNLVFSSFYANDGQYRYYLPICSSDSSVFNVFFNPWDYRSVSCFMFGGTYCNLYGSRGQSFYFQNYSTGANVLGDVTFGDGLSALAWFFDQCGINIRPGSSSAYGAVNNEPPPITIDVTKYDQTITNITNNYQEGDTITMVFPSYYTTNNYYNYDDYRQHPEYIMDFDQDGLLNSDFNLPTYDGNILATKFPFCIPFDVYNLVSNLVVEPEAPQFHWLVLPANSFGMTNDDFYIDLDFTPYNFLVQLMRFFIAVGFLVWLMTKTKDLMQ